MPPSRPGSAPNTRYGDPLRRCVFQMDENKRHHAHVVRAPQRKWSIEMDRPRPGKRRHRLIAAAVVSVAVAVAVAPAAANAAVAATRDLTTPGTLRIAGSPANVIGSKVALLGDVNGDGIGDLAPSGFPFDPNQGNMGRVEAAFGRASSGRIETDPVPAGGGFQITGVAFGFGLDLFNLSSFRPAPSVAAAGDVNGDGLADIIVGASAFGLSDTQQ